MRGSNAYEPLNLEVDRMPWPQRVNMKKPMKVDLDFRRRCLRWLSNMSDLADNREVDPERPDLMRRWAAGEPEADLE
jgi:hypothetical protein